MIGINRNERSQSPKYATEQVNLAFEKFDSGKATFVDHESANSRMAERKAKIRNRGKL